MNTTHTDENDLYHADTRRIGKSGLDLIAKSPAHYYAQYLDPNRVREPSKRHFVVGSVTHNAILENTFLEQKYFVLDDTDIIRQIGGGNPRATNRYKEWKQMQLANNEGKSEITIDDWNAVLRMREKVHQHKCSVLLDEGKAEYRIDWTNNQLNTPVACKAKPDWLAANDWIVDLKTTEDASPAGFAKSVWNYRYHVQAAFYWDAFTAHFGREPQGFLFIAVEKSAPHLVATYWITPQIPLFDLGRRTYLHDLNTYRECLMRDEWPGYGEELMPLSIPGWAERQVKHNETV